SFKYLSIQTELLGNFTDDSRSSFDEALVVVAVFETEERLESFPDADVRQEAVLFVAGSDLAAKFAAKGIIPLRGLKKIGNFFAEEIEFSFEEGPSAAQDANHLRATRKLRSHKSDAFSTANLDVDF